MYYFITIVPKNLKLGNLFDELILSVDKCLRPLKDVPGLDSKFDVPGLESTFGVDVDVDVDDDIAGFGIPYQTISSVRS